MQAFKLTLGFELLPASAKEAFFIFGYKVVLFSLFSFPPHFPIGSSPYDQGSSFHRRVGHRLLGNYPHLQHDWAGPRCGTHISVQKSLHVCCLFFFLLYFYWFLFIFFNKANALHSSVLPGSRQQCFLRRHCTVQGVRWLGGRPILRARMHEDFPTGKMHLLGEEGSLLCDHSLFYWISPRVHPGNWSKRDAGFY